MAPNTGRLVYTGYWNDYLVEIEDSGDHRSLYFGARSLQGRMSLANPHDLVLSYTRYMAAALLVKATLKNILIVGIGAGSLIRFFLHHFTQCQIDAVDYAPQLITIAKDFFHLPDNNQLSVYCADGRSFLQDSSDKKYDLILIDAFDDRGMAATVYSEHFFSLCAEALAPDGVLSCNLWSDDGVRLAEIKTILADYFEGCLYLPVPDHANIVAIAMPFPIPWPRIYLKRKEITSLSRCYNLNFRRLIKVAKQHNINFFKRIWLR